jgi:hypothetical protein
MARSRSVSDSRYTIAHDLGIGFYSNILIKNFYAFLITLVAFTLLTSSSHRRGSWWAKSSFIDSLVYALKACTNSKTNPNLRLINSAPTANDLLVQWIFHIMIN